MKRFSAIGLSLLVSFFLTGCASNKVSTSSSSSSATGLSSQDDMIQADLNYAAQSVSTSLNQLAEIEKSNHQGNLVMPFDNISDPALKQPIVITWYGPIAPVLATVANKIGYKLQVYGKQPQTPVIVNVDTTGSQTSALDVIRNLDLQAGQNANILIYTDTKILSLRYTAT